MAFPDGPHVQPGAHLIFKSATGGLTSSGWFMLAVSAWLIVTAALSLTGRMSGRFRAKPWPKWFDLVVGVVGLLVGIGFLIVVFLAKPDHLY